MLFCNTTLAEERECLSPRLSINSGLLNFAWSGLEVTADQVMMSIKNLAGQRIVDSKRREEFVLQAGSGDAYAAFSFDVIRLVDNELVGTVPLEVKQDYKGNLLLSLGYVHFLENVKGENYQGKGLFYQILHVISDRMPEGSLLFLHSLEETSTLKKLGQGAMWCKTRMGRIMEGCGWKLQLMEIFDKEKSQTAVVVDIQNRWKEYHNPEKFYEILDNAISNIDETGDIDGALVRVTLVKAIETPDYRVGSIAESYFKEKETKQKTPMLSCLSNIQDEYLPLLFDTVWNEFVGSNPEAITASTPAASAFFAILTFNTT